MIRTRALLGSLGVALVLFAARESGAAEHSNSLIRLPYGGYFADVDGDGVAELLQVSSNRVFVNRLDYAGTGYAHFYFDAPIRELLIGRFRGLASSDICARLNNGVLTCIGLRSDGAGFSRFHSMADMVSTSERVVVGDFSGDGKDDLLLHDSGAGTVRFFHFDYFPTLPTPTFVSLSVDLGNLAGVDLHGKEIYAGEFGLSVGQDDLVILSPSNGQVIRLDSVIYNGRTTFWWAFTTNGGVVASNEKISVANVKGGNTDSLAIYNASTGATRFRDVVYANGNLADPGVGPGQIAAPRTNGSRPYFAKLAFFWGEQGAAVRDDALVYDAGTQQYVRSDARWSGGATYWWAYSKAVRRLDSDFPALGPLHKWLVILCKDADQSNYTPETPSWYSDLYTASGGDLPGQYNFFKEMSYGQENYAASVVGWVQLSTNQATRERQITWKECVDAAGINPSNYFRVVAVTNGNDDFGGSSYGSWTTTTLNLWAGMLQGDGSHEMGHAYGLGHAYDDTQNDCSWGTPGEYCDPYDPMGTQYTFQYLFPGAWGVSPAYSQPSRIKLGWVPAARQVTLVPSGTRGSHVATVQIAASNRPESVGALALNVRFFGDSDASHRYIVEYRQKSNWWDAALPRDAVLVREYRSGIAYLKTSPHSDFQPGETFSGANNVQISVLSFDATQGTATLQVVY